MAKGKTVTAAEIREVLAALNDAADRIIEMQRRIGNGHLGDIPEALSYARDTVRIARDLNDFALRMFNAHDALAMRAKLAEGARLKAELKADAEERE
jgi:hypothetical protein